MLSILEFAGKKIKILKKAKYLDKSISLENLLDNLKLDSFI